MYNYVNKRTIIRGLQGDVAFDLSLDLWKDFSQLRGRRASLVAQTVKCLPAMRETRVRSQVGKIPWRKKWQPTPVLLPGKFHGWSSLVGYNPWDHKESDTTEQLQWFTGEEESSVSKIREKATPQFVWLKVRTWDRIIFLAVPCSIWDLSSPNKHQTHDPCTGSAVLITGPPGKTCRVLTARPSGKSCEAEYNALFRMLGWGQLGVLNIWLWRLNLIRCMCVPSCFSHVQHFATPWTVAHWAPWSMEFSRQEYWSGLLFPSPGDLPDPGIEPMSLTSPALAGRFFTISATWCTRTILISHSSQEEE